MVVLIDISEQQPSSSLSSYKYDVFLSFRGEDTRYNFTDHLLKALQEANIDTFYDDAEIRLGEFLKPELESAIRASRSSIIVLSKDYASSSWCLDELALIMEQRITSQHIAFPIFYNVKPSDVRKQQNSFGVAMAEHKHRMEAESNAEKQSQLANKIRSWVKALTEVADMKGEEANGRRETILIAGIVKEITTRLDLHKRSVISKLIGMKSSVKTITSFLKDGSKQSTEFLTIWGMAGIGKTYLADYIFKSHYHEFESSCFLEDIERRCIPPNGVLDLQKQLLKDIGARSWMDINDVNTITMKIEKSLLRKRTLLVLDGINKFEQLDLLIGTKGFGPGSKIIITSKNSLLTEKCRLFEKQVPTNHTKHLLKGLDVKESLELLSFHAFGCNEPNISDKKELMKVVKYCEGHPLALKVLGSSLRSEDTTWDDILESLGKEINPDITKVLKISFDTLPFEKDKELFKHIASLFVGEDRKYTEDILKACGVCKSSGFKTLINRCLLTIDTSDRLMMHQLLQDMGRDIVRQESPKKPWKRSILWHHEECLDMLQNRQGTTMIQGLALDMRTSENETLKESVVWWLFDWVSGMCSSFRRTSGGFETLALSEMRNLRLLQLNYVQLSGSYKNFPPGLRWLCLHGFPLSYIPSDLQMKNMVALDMSNSKLQHLWKKPKLLRSLQFLNLSNCHELVRVSQFSDLPLLKKLTLKKLTLKRCTSLVEVCESIGDHCHKLEDLDLSECKKLEKLPKSVGKLKKLKTISINGCSNLEDLPVELKDMDELKVLSADKVKITSPVPSCSDIVEAIPTSSKPFVISLPRSLVRLSLKNNNLCNESFLVDFSSLLMLKELYLDKNPIESMPDCVKSLSKLEKLSFNNCHELKTVLCAPNTLQLLDILNCHSLKKVTFFPEKSAPPEFNCFDASTMTEIQDVFKIQDLSEIDKDILHRLGWENIKYWNFRRLAMADCDECYHYIRKFVPTQVLYEHGIFSTFLAEQEVPNWFTHRSKAPSFTLQASPQNGKIKGINVCIAYTLSSLMDVGPFRIEIRNLTKNSSWTYQPITYALAQSEEFEYGDEVVVWLSHWMFGKNEFEDGDEVSIDFCVKYHYNHYFPGEELFICYGGEGANHANVKEYYGVSLVYNDGNDRKRDPLDYYKSWKHIISNNLLK